MMEWIYIFAGLFLLVLIAGLFSGSSVVTTDFSANAKKNATVYYYLPESIIKIRANVKIAVVYNSDDSTLNASSRIIEQSFVTTTEIIADTTDLLSLNYKPGALMADDIKYGVNSKGLLETVSITTEDRTAEIISRLAEAPQVILGASASVAKAPDTIVKIKEFNADFSVKASSVSNVPLLIGWNLIIPNELGKDEFITVTADYKLSSSNSTTAPTLASLINGAAKSKSETEGILTRPLKNIQLKIEAATAGFNNTLPVNVTIADATKLITIPVNRTPFVKQVNKIGIQDGIILSNEINKPSSVEGVLSIPINVAKALVSIPGQLIQFRYDNTKRLDEFEKIRLTYEKSIQENKKFSVTKEMEFEKVKLDIRKTELSNEIELQKLQLELQKSLLEAETRQLEAQKALNAIKKELEQLKEKK